MMEFSVTKQNVKRVSMGDIAKRAGVSAMTVSRALKGDIKQVRSSAIDQTLKIRQIAEEMGYRKSSVPRSMISGRFNTVTLLGSNSWRRNQVSPLRIIGLQEQAYQHGLSILLAQADDSELLDKKSLPSMIHEMNSDGVLINYTTGYPEALEELLQRYQIPAVWLNTKHASDCIYPDDYSGARQAVDYLLELGHRRIASFIPRKNIAEHYSVKDRMEGINDALKAVQLEPIVMELNGCSSYHKYHSWIHSYLKKKNRPTAIIANGIHQAVAVQSTAGELGLKIPQDLSLIVFHEEKDVFQITTMQIPEKELGKQALELLIKKIDNPEKLFNPVALPMSLELKNVTCGRAPELK